MNLFVLRSVLGINPMDIELPTGMISKIESGDIQGCKISELDLYVESFPRDTREIVFIAIIFSILRRFLGVA